MPLEAFKFKQFSVAHDRCAMKVGTDAVILGAWAAINHLPKSILDIGAGSGILSLMLAQRSNANLIDGLEIDVEAFEQCVTNFEASPWSDRLFCYHCSLGEFTAEIQTKYELIISNPPFYSTYCKGVNQSRKLARFEGAMPFDELLYSVKLLMTENGKFCTVIPYEMEDKFTKIAKKNSLYCNKILRVRGQKNKIIKRSFAVFSFKKKSTVINEMFIEEERHIYSKDYIQMTKEFYLKF